ncbi:hypothetical protein TYRP_012000 [Tyrophagus putrescentiae]|nr:hypothetical protein TYRP_012000 [Tyrophagus putrescentiae]
MDTASLEPKFRKPAPYDRANIFSKVIFGTAQPLLLGRVIRYFGGGNDETKKISYLEACLTAGGLCLMLFTQQTVNHPTMLHLKRLGMRLRVAAAPSSTKSHCD